MNSMKLLLPAVTSMTTFLSNLCGNGLHHKEGKGRCEECHRIASARGGRKYRKTARYKHWLATKRAKRLGLYGNIFRELATKSWHAST